MEFVLKRRFLGPNYTVGTLSADGVYLCDTLEPANRDLNKNGKFDNGEKKIAPKTAIPYGRYEVRLTYSNKFERILPLLINVPSFEGVRIHRGNNVSHTAGCILPGENKKKGMVLNSTHYELRIVSIMRACAAKKEKVYITIQ